MSILCAKLHNGVLMPAVAMGTYKLEQDDPRTTAAIHTSLSLGYRAIDTAYAYANERTVGAAIRTWDKVVKPQPKIEPFANFISVTEEEFLANFAVPHGKPSDDRRVFVTSKTPEGARFSIEEHLKNMGRESTDMFILHWPGAHTDFANAEWNIEAEMAGVETKMKDPKNAEKRIAVWKEMEKIYAEGKARVIGLSNYMGQHLAPLLEDIKRRQKEGDKFATIPMFNQFEVSPLLKIPDDLKKLCLENNILIGSYSTLGSFKGVELMMNDPKLQKIGAQHGKSVSSVILRWALQSGYAILPKSVNPERIAANIALFDFNLSDDELKTIDAMECGTRYCPDPNMIV